MSRESRTRRRGPDTFRCKRCRFDVPMHAPGTRHRNHCPLCLWSRHLDSAPGDRASGCAGAMEPIAVAVQDDGEWSLVHRCGACSVVHLNRIAGDDNAHSLLQLASKPLAQPPFPLQYLNGLVGPALPQRVHARDGDRHARVVRRCLADELAQAGEVVAPALAGQPGPQRVLAAGVGGAAQRAFELVAGLDDPRHVGLDQQWCAVRPQRRLDLTGQQQALDLAEVAVHVPEQPTLNVLGTICYTPEDFADTIAMIQDGRIKTEGMVTERIALTDVVAGGFDELVEHKDRHVKILVRAS